MAQHPLFPYSTAINCVTKFINFFLSKFVHMYSVVERLQLYVLL